MLLIYINKEIIKKFKLQLIIIINKSTNFDSLYKVTWSDLQTAVYFLCERFNINSISPKYCPSTKFANYFCFNFNKKIKITINIIYN